MSGRIRLTRAAEQDLSDAAHWYQREAPYAVSRFRREVREAHQRIAENPLQYRDVHRGIRRALVRSFPYMIFYRQTAEAVQVIAITHQTRDPYPWT